MELYEILVPTMMNGLPVRTRHHKEWDKVVRNMTGGMTILKPAKGQWLDELSGNTLHEERVIPVRLACTYIQLHKVIEFTLKHYNQLAVMAYKVSDEVYIVRRETASE